MSVIGFGTLTKNPPPSGSINNRASLCYNPDYNDCQNTITLDGSISRRSESLGNCKNTGAFDGDASWSSNIKSLNIPIGTWLRVFKSEGNKKTSCRDTNQEVQRMFWGGNDTDFGQLGQRVPDNVATGCAKPFVSRGKPHVYGFNKRGGDDIVSNLCSIGISDSSITFLDNAGRYQGGVHYPSYCQLGDYIKEKQECKDLTSNIRLRGLDPVQTWAHFAMDRYCGKQGIKDPNITDANVFSRATSFTLNGTRVKTKFAPENMIQTSDCDDYCGGAGTTFSDKCQENKRNMCSNPNQWVQNPDKVQTYCRNFWKETDNFNVDDVNQACGDILVKSDDQNVFAGNGCGFLCSGGTPINEEYCIDRKIQFCLQPQVDQDGNPSYKNMFTDDCFGFCVQKPEQCIQGSVDVDGTTDLTGLGDFCTNKYNQFKQNFINENIVSDPNNITPEEQDKIDNFETLFADKIQGKSFLQQDVGSFGKKLADFCGCLLPSPVYQGHIDNITQKYADNDLIINLTAQNTKRECFYPQCKDSSIPSNNTVALKRDCTDCVSNIYQDFQDSNLSQVCVISQQENCGGGGIFTLDPNGETTCDDGGDFGDDLPDIGNIDEGLKTFVWIIIFACILIVIVLVAVGIIRMTGGSLPGGGSMDFLGIFSDEPLLSSDLLRELQEGYNATFAN